MSNSNKRFAAGQKRVQGALGKTRAAASALGGQLRTLVGGFAALAAARDAIRTMAGFESQMSELRGVTNATAIQMEIMEDTVRELGANTRFSAAEAAEGMTFLARAGFDVAEATEALPATLNLAAAGSLELGEAADIASNVLSAFSLQASETTRVVDVLLTTANNANTNVQQLGDAFEYVGPVAGALQVPIEETAAALGVLGNAGIQASSAGTGLRGVLTRLLNPSGKARAALEQMGITAADVNPEMHSLTDIFKTFRERNLGASQALDIFGQRHVAAALAITSQTDALETLIEKNQAAEGAAARVARIMDDNLAGAVKALRSAFEELYLELGDSGVAGGLRDVVDTATQLLRVLGGNKEAIEEANPVIKAMAAATKLVSAAIMFLVDTIGDGFSKIGQAFSWLMGETGKFGDAAGSAMDALVDGTLSVSDVVDGLSATFQKVGAFFDAFFARPLANAIVNLQEIVEGFADFFEEALKSPLAAIVQSIAAFASTTLDLIRGLMNQLADMVSYLSEDVADSIRGLGEGIEAYKGDIKDAADYLAGDAGPKMEEAIDRIKRGSRGVFSSLVPDLQQLEAQIDEFKAKSEEIDEELRQKMIARNEAEVAAEQEKTDALLELRQAQADQQAAMDAMNGGTEDDPAEQQREENQAKLEALREGFATEMELLAEQYDERRIFLEELKSSEFAYVNEREDLLTKTIDAYEAKRTEIQQKHEKQRSAMMRAEWMTRLMMAQNTMLAIQQILIATGNSALAESKAFGVAQAVISTAIGITRAMELGWPAAIPAMALAAATGAAQIAAITSAQKGSGAPPTAPGGGGAVAAQPPPATTDNIEDVATTLSEVGNVDEEAPEAVEGTLTINMEGVSRTDVATVGDITDNIGEAIDTYVESGGRFRTIAVNIGE
jgi:TP901 family phage tail tape measure protein